MSQMNMAKGFRATVASAWVSLQGDREECFLAHGYVSHTATRDTERTQPFSHTHHPAAHCVSMATSRPGPWMLEISARGGGVGKRETERRNSRHKDTQKDSLTRRPPLFPCAPCQEDLNELRARGWRGLRWELSNGWWLSGLR